MQIQLSDHFTYGKLLRFTLPSIIMMIFTSVYSVVVACTMGEGKEELSLMSKADVATRILDIAAGLVRA